MKHFTQDSTPPPMKRYRKTALAEAVQIHEPFAVETLEGTMTAKAGDWLMRGPAGELYPCDAAIFASTYVEANDPEQIQAAPASPREAADVATDGVNHFPAPVLQALDDDALERPHIFIRDDTGATAALFCQEYIIVGSAFDCALRLRGLEDQFFGLRCKPGAPVELVNLGTDNIFVAFTTQKGGASVYDGNEWCPGVSLSLPENIEQFTIRNPRTGITLYVKYTTARSLYTSWAETLAHPLTLNWRLSKLEHKLQDVLARLESSESDVRSLRRQLRNTRGIS